MRYRRAHLIDVTLNGVRILRVEINERQIQDISKALEKALADDLRDDGAYLSKLDIRAGQAIKTILKREQADLAEGA